MVSSFQLEKSMVEEFVQESVDEFSISVGCKEGDGMTGSLHSIKVTTTSGKVLHLVYKAIDKSDPVKAKQLADVGLFTVEILVYSKLIPMLTQLGVAESDETVKDLVIPAPKLLHYYTGDKAVDSYICMEDVRPDGFQMTDKYSGLSLAEAGLVMKEIAKFHALTYSLIRWEGDKIFSKEFAPFHMYQHSKYISLLQPFCYAVNGSVINAIDLMKTRNPKLHQRMETHLGETTSEATSMDPKVQFPTRFQTDVNYFPVIIHGDLWSNNILFKYSDEDTQQNPIALKFLDFQLSRRGNIYEDLSYFVLTSTTPQFRSNHLPLILNVYYDTFLESLELINVPKPIGFTKGTFIDAFQRVIPDTYRYMCVAIPLQLGTPLSEVAKMSQQNEGPQGQSDPPPPMSRKDGMKLLIQAMRVQMETSSRAMDRLEAITQEMAHLKVI